MKSWWLTKVLLYVSEEKETRNMFEKILLLLAYTIPYKQQFDKLWCSTLITSQTFNYIYKIYHKRNKNSINN